MEQYTIIYNGINPFDTVGLAIARVTANGMVDAVDKFFAIHPEYTTDDVVGIAVTPLNDGAFGSFVYGVRSPRTITITEEPLLPVEVVVS